MKRLVVATIAMAVLAGGHLLAAGFAKIGRASCRERV